MPKSKMIKNKHYKGFTLVELLIVMAVIIILLAIGLLSGRAAIERANRLRHQNNVGEIYKALTAYYVENNKYPTASTGVDTSETFAQTGEEITGAAAPVYCLFTAGANCGAGGAELAEFLDGSIEGGGMSANYYYYTDSDNQIVLICYLAFNNDFAGCAGNGFDTLPASSPITDAQFGADEYTFVCGTGCRQGQWDAADEEWKTGVSTITN